MRIEAADWDKWLEYQKKKGVLTNPIQWGWWQHKNKGRQDKGLTEISEHHVDTVFYTTNEPYSEPSDQVYLNMLAYRKYLCEFN